MLFSLLRSHALKKISGFHHWAVCLSLNFSRVIVRDRQADKNLSYLLLYRADSTTIDPSPWGDSLQNFVLDLPSNEPGRLRWLEGCCFNRDTVKYTDLDR